MKIYTSSYSHDLLFLPYVLLWWRRQLNIQLLMHAVNRWLLSGYTISMWLHQDSRRQDWHGVDGQVVMATQHGCIYTMLWRLCLLCLYIVNTLLFVDRCCSVMSVGSFRYIHCKYYYAQTFLALMIFVIDWATQFGMSGCCFFCLFLSFCCRCCCCAECMYIWNACMKESWNKVLYVCHLKGHNTFFFTHLHSLFVIASFHQRGWFI